MRTGVVGPFTWFSGHFPENWEADPDVYCVDVDESDYRFLIYLINFRPDITLFYRPELYPKRFLDAIPGRKIAFLSEPVPRLVNGALMRSSETDLRLQVYSQMNWASFDKIVFYDRSKMETVHSLGWPVSDFRPMPIDTSVFRPNSIADRPIDVFFIGKPTPHRIAQLDFLRTMKVNFRWVAHGLSGGELAETFRMSKVVLNIHADGLPATEPRIHLAAACGCIVLSETIDGDVDPFQDRVIEFGGALDRGAIRQAIDRYLSTSLTLSSFEKQFSARRFIIECAGEAGV